jgi:small subunit ribosomal protein S2
MKEDDNKKKLTFPENKIELDIEKMAQAGLHLGHKITKIHPKMKPYIYGVKNTFHIIDLTKTAKKFREALEFIKELIKENKNLLLIGTRPQAKILIKELAKELDLPYVTERWLGGTFTNFEQIKNRTLYLKDLEKKKESGEFEKYSKKERIKIEKELENMRKKFEGLKNLEELPEAIFVLDIKKDSLACKEAKKRGIKIIGIVDTNADPNLVDYPIPANDDAISSLKYILSKVKEAILRGKKESEELKTKTE